MPNDLREETVSEMRDRARKNARDAGWGHLHRAVVEAENADLIDDPAYWPNDDEDERAKAIMAWVNAVLAYTRKG